jgi:hypothetical protein
MKTIIAITETPIRRSPQITIVRRSYPYTRNPIIIVIIFVVTPITRNPQVSIFGAIRLFVIR